MKQNAIEMYTAALRERLEPTLAAQDADEVVSEVRAHLGERAEELLGQGQDAVVAEITATREFGPVEEMARELAQGFPPKPPVDPSRLSWLPPVALAVLLGFAAVCYATYGGTRGIEAAVGCLLPSTPMLMVPALTASFGRLKYRRLRLAKVLLRLSQGGFGVAAVGTLALLGLQITGNATLSSTYPTNYVFAGVCMAMFAMTQAMSRNGRVFNALASWRKAR